MKSQARLGNCFQRSCTVGSAGNSNWSKIEEEESARENKIKKRENNQLGVEDAGERWKERIKPRGLKLEEKHKSCGDKV